MDKHTENGGHVEVPRTLWPHTNGWLLTPPGEPVTFERGEDGVWIASDGSTAKVDDDGVLNIRVYAVQKVTLTVTMEESDG